MRHLSNKYARAIMALCLILGFGFAFNLTVQAQRRPYRMNDRQISEIIRRLEVNAGRFRSSLDATLDRSRRDGTRAEDDINAFVRDFDYSVEQLSQRFNGRRSAASDVEVVLQKAAVIDNFMGRRRAVRGAQDEWLAVKADLNTLASAYSVNRRWDNGIIDPIGRTVSNDGRRGRNWDRYENFGGSFDLRQTALNAGYNEGLRAGQNDRSRNRTSDYRNSIEYQRATSDYSSRLGDRELYRRYYRAGFENGYNDGYGAQVGYPQGNTWPPTTTGDNYGNYGGTFQLRQTALNAGYNKGLALGREDRNRGRRDVRSFDDYQKATEDYSSRLGDRELYRRYYREAFENGYNTGYNGY
jgi:hypothetical protein